MFNLFQAVGSGATGVHSHEMLKMIKIDAVLKIVASKENETLQ